MRMKKSRCLHWKVHLLGITFIVLVSLFYFNATYKTFIVGLSVSSYDEMMKDDTKMSLYNIIQNKNIEMKLLKDRLLEMEKRLEKGKIISDFTPTIYMITPTYSRMQQKADLTRLYQTLMHVKNLHWIVIEDSVNKTKLVTNLLNQNVIKYTHLNAKTPDMFVVKPNESRHRKPRGVSQRNAGITWIRETLNPDIDKGVAYFADDDNTYDLKVFEEIRKTRKVSVFPVGLVGNLRYESPIIKNGKVVEWHSFIRRNRTFAVDMAGFSINIKFFFDYPNFLLINAIPPINQENQLFLGFKITLKDLEPRADNCTKVLVWHTRTERVNLAYEQKIPEKYGGPSDPNIEV